MSTISMIPTSPIGQRDIRSASKPFKRDKDQGAKWSNGERPSPGCAIKWSNTGEEVVGGSESQKAKVRPQKSYSQTYGEPKSRANVTPKHSSLSGWDHGRSQGRVARTTEAHFDAQDDTLSRSLLELVPRPVLYGQSSTIPTADSGALYSFDNTGPSPNEYGRKIGLEGLVERAEKKWVSEQTEKMVRGEYEVLDEQGETTTFKKGKKSPKQKSIKNEPAVVKDVEDDDGFELV